MCPCHFTVDLIRSSLLTWAWRVSTVRANTREDAWAALGSLHQRWYVERPIRWVQRSGAQTAMAWVWDDCSAFLTAIKSM